MILFVVSNYLFMVVSFVRPGESAGWKTLWHTEAGGNSWLSSCLGSIRLAFFLLIAFDIFVPMVAIAVPFSFLPEVLRYFHVCFKGNSFTSVTAVKEISPPSYGSTR